MKGLIVNVSVPGTNPLVLRRLRIGSGYMVADLAFAASAALGLEAELLSAEKDGTALTPERRLEEALQPGESCSLTLTFPESQESLTLPADALQETELQEGEDLPALLMALGPGLPQGCADMRTVRRIHAEVLQGRAVSFGGQAFSRKSLEPSDRTFANAMLKRYDPEHAVQEINLKLGQPLQLLLNRKKVTELKDIAR